MQLLHFTQIALYAFLTMYLLGGNVGGLTNLLCSHNEIRHRGKEAGPRFIYLIFYGLFFCNCSIFFFSCGWCDDVVVDIWQTVLDALKLVVMCNCVRLWGSGLCITGGGGAVPFHLDPPLHDTHVLVFQWNGTGHVAWCVLICSTDTLEEAILCDNHRKSKTPNQKMLLFAVLHWAPPL